MRVGRFHGTKERYETARSRKASSMRDTICALAWQAEDSATGGILDAGEGVIVGVDARQCAATGGGARVLRRAVDCAAACGGAGNRRVSLRQSGGPRRDRVAD